MKLPAPSKHNCEVVYASHPFLSSITVFIKGILITITNHANPQLHMWVQYYVECCLHWTHKGSQNTIWNAHQECEILILKSDGMCVLTRSAFLIHCWGFLFKEYSVLIAMSGYINQRPTQRRRDCFLHSSFLRWKFYNKNTFSSKDKHANIFWTTIQYSFLVMLCYKPQINA
jgi:hypothetical protein